MRRMIGLVTALGIIGAIAQGWGGGSALAAPVSPTYVGVERTIESIRREWAKPGAPAVPKAEEWNAQLDALMENLRSYARADQDSVRQTALDRVSQIDDSLGTASWESAATLREELQQWLQPRVRLARARNG